MPASLLPDMSGHDGTDGSPFAPSHGAIAFASIRLVTIVVTHE